jgi:hypothetical protein
MDFIQGWTVGLIGLHILVLGAGLASDKGPIGILAKAAISLPIWGRVLGWW